MVPNAKMVNTYWTILSLEVVTAMNSIVPIAERPQTKGHLVLNLSASQEQATTYTRAAIYGGMVWSAVASSVLKSQVELRNHYLH